MDGQQTEQTTVKGRRQPRYGAGAPTTAGLTKELWQAAVNLRGNIEPADYKRYVLPIIFLRFRSLRYEQRREVLEGLVKEPASEYFGMPAVLDHPDEYRRVGAFVLPEETRWESIVRIAQAT